MNGVRRLFTASSSSGGTSTTTATAVDPSVARADGSTAWTPLIIGRAPSQSAEQPNRDQKRSDGSPSHSLERPGQLQTTSSILKIRPTESPESISMSPSASRGRMPPSVSVTKGSASALIRKKPYDDLLLDLLASESAIECKGFQTLEPKEMAALKKEQSLLESRLDAVTRKLNLESRIRNATHSFDKTKSRTKAGPDSTPGEVDSAKHKVELVQRDLWQLKERSYDISRRLLEHHCSILSSSIRKSDSCNTPQHDSLSASSTPSGRHALDTRFGAAHLYANHSGASAPTSAKATEEHLQQLTEELALVKIQHGEKSRQYEDLEAQKVEREGALQRDLRSAEEELARLRKDAGRVAGFQGQVDQLMEERENWEREMENLRKLLDERLEHISSLENELRVVDAKAESKADELLKQQKEWAVERRGLLAKLEAESHQWEEERSEVESRINEQAALLDNELKLRRQERDQVLGALRSSVERHQIPAEDDSAFTLAKALSAHLDTVTAEVDSLRKSRIGIDTDLVASVKINGLRSPMRSLSTDEDSVGYHLKSLWSILPSPEARAVKLGNRTKTNSSPVSAISSLSELDVRALKSLYDRKGGRTITPAGDFSIEAFAQRVQALVADDRALIERLIRFAQGHELLRSNAERAQKLARESSLALETYQKQVKALQDRNEDFDSVHGALANQVAELSQQVGKLKAEKLELEMRAAKQTVQLANLTTANEALSAKTLSMAEEPQSARVYLEAQLSELQQALKTAENEVEGMRNSELAQQLQKANLLDELNTMQNDNAKLREQLRAEQRKQK